MKNIIVVMLLVFTAFGCAHLASHQEEVATDGSRRITDLHSTTFFDSKSDLAKFKAMTTDKTQSLGIGAYNAESSGSNAVAIVGAVVEAAVSSAVKSAKPVP